MFGAAEFQEIIADYNIEPWGDLRADLRAATIVQAIREVGCYVRSWAGAKNVKMPKLEDCMLEFGMKPQREQSPEAQVAYLKMWFGSAEKKDGK